MGKWRQGRVIAIINGQMETFMMDGERMSSNYYPFFIYLGNENDETLCPTEELTTGSGA